MLHWNTNNIVAKVFLMLRDVMLRLHNNSFSILALAMKVKYAKLVMLNNMTMFTVDDLSIFSGSHTYISNVSFLHQNYGAFFDTWGVGITGSMVLKGDNGENSDEEEHELTQWEAIIWLAILTTEVSILSGYLVEAIWV
ncbi:hypothetical protein JHK82_050052 [Glycine max]|nr:hypothetical protein JHK82_050052 [Glycine max]